MSLHHPGKATGNSQGEGPPKAKCLKGKWEVKHKVPDEYSAFKPNSFLGCAEVKKMFRTTEFLFALQYRKHMKSCALHYKSQV